MQKDSRKFVGQNHEMLDPTLPTLKIIQKKWNIWIIETSLLAMKEVRMQIKHALSVDVFRKERLGCSVVQDDMTGFGCCTVLVDRWICRQYACIFLFFIDCFYVFTCWPTNGKSHSITWHSLKKWFGRSLIFTIPCRSPKCVIISKFLTYFCVLDFISTFFQVSETAWMNEWWPHSLLLSCYSLMSSVRCHYTFLLEKRRPKISYNFIRVMRNLSA